MVFVSGVEGVGLDLLEGLLPGVGPPAAVVDLLGVVDDAVAEDAPLLAHGREVRGVAGDEGVLVEVNEVGRRGRGSLGGVLADLLGPLRWWCGQGRLTPGRQVRPQGVIKQLNKLVDVIKVNDFSEVDYVERGLALVKISVNKSNRAEIMQMVGIFRTRIVDVSQDSMTVEITGDEEKIEAFISMVMPYGIKEVCRTGEVALARGNNKQ